MTLIDLPPLLLNGRGDGVSAQGAADCMENALTGFALLVSGSFPVTPTTERRVSKVDITRIPLFVRKFLRL